MTRLARHLNSSLAAVAAVAVAALLAAPGAEALSADARVVVIDTLDRDAVAALYRDVIGPALEVPNDWKGSTGLCQAGAVGEEFRAAELSTLNAVRSLAGLTEVTENAGMSALAQQAALIMLANSDLSHSPPPDWKCWTSEGSRGAGTSNLYLGETGASAILGYMVDPGAGNAFVGHRRWILSQDLTQVGMGNTSNSNALAVIGALRPATSRAWVPWPTSGYFPAGLWPQGRGESSSRWSLSYPKADFSESTVSMTREGQPVAVTINPYAPGYGDNSIVWQANTPRVQRGNDVTFDIVVGNIRMPTGELVSHSYSTTVIDPYGPPPSPPTNVRAAVTSKKSVTVSWDAPSTQGGSPVQDYTVYLASGATACTASVGTSCVVNGLKRGRSYVFYVTASNVAGESGRSDASNEVVLASTPSKVSVTSVDCSTLQCTVRWDPAPSPGLPIVRYEFRLASTKFWLSTSARSVVIKRRGSSQGDMLVIRAVNSLGHGPQARARLDW